MTSLHPVHVVCATVLAVLLCCSAEIFSSVAKLKALPHLERALLKKFQDFLKTTPDVDGKIRGRLQRLNAKNIKDLHNLNSLESPLHAFRVLKRLVHRWESLMKLINCSIRDSISDERDFSLVSALLNSTRTWMTLQTLWPTKADVSGAAMALVRLHRLYDLDYADLLRGHFLHERSYPLTSSELTYLTKAALELGLPCDAEELLAALQVISKKVDGLEMKSVAKLRDRVSQLSISKMTDCNKNRSKSEVPVYCPLMLFVTQGNSEGAIDGWHTASDQFSKTSVRQAYEEMCRKTVQASFAFGSGRDCYMHATFIPYLRYRSEVVNSDPLILVFHDVIDDAEISEMKDLAFGKLSPSSLALTQVTHEKHLVRVSQNAWLFDSTPTLARISRRVELVTGLSTRVISENTHAEPYQVLNYGLGGVYGPHEDSVRLPRRSGNEDVPLLRNSGDRTATWMYYLSDVPLGGATVFPFLQAGIRPQKGTAVLWYNLKRNGEGDMRVVHAGCPVLYGDKWVANKWLREIGNVFKRPCLLDPSL